MEYFQKSKDGFLLGMLKPLCKEICHLLKDAKVPKMFTPYFEYLRNPQESKTA